MRELEFPIQKDVQTRRVWTCEHSDTCTRTNPCPEHFHLRANKGRRRSAPKPFACVTCGTVFHQYRPENVICKRSCAPPRKRRPLEERLWAKVDKDGPNGCWLWMGGRTPLGYGHVSVETPEGWRTRRVHRVTYELLVGPIPEGLTLDHLCRTPACCNPDHLEPVTVAENLRRAAAARRAA